MTAIKGLWGGFKAKHPAIAQFLVFFVLSNGVTVLQLMLMPLFRSALAGTGLTGIAFQALPVGKNLDGSTYYIFNYAAGKIAEDGTGGGLAYFLAVEVTLAIAQIINFFAQRKITFKATNNIWRAAMWYVAAYIGITLLAGALQGLYKAPLYNFLKGALGGAGESAADVVTMLVNSAISFWVFFPIFKVIFKSGKTGSLR
jgi:putative flippase GtrA